MGSNPSQLVSTSEIITPVTSYRGPVVFSFLVSNCFLSHPPPHPPHPPTPPPPPPPPAGSAPGPGQESVVDIEAPVDIQQPETYGLILTSRILCFSARSPGFCFATGKSVPGPVPGRGTDIWSTGMGTGVLR